MHISPIDIQKKEFRSRLLGYDKEAVDGFLELVADEMERLRRQIGDLREELDVNQSALQEMRDREATLKETLVTTQKVTDELRANAHREVEILLGDAELKAERVLRNAEERRTELIGEIQEIKRQKIDFESSLRSLLEKHIRMLDLHPRAIEEQEQDARLGEEPLPFEARENRLARTGGGSDPEDGE